MAFYQRSSVSITYQAKLTIAHNRYSSFQSISTFEVVYEELQVEAQELMAEYEKRARDVGVSDTQVVIEMGNPKTLLAKTTRPLI